MSAISYATVNNVRTTLAYQNPKGNLINITGMYSSPNKRTVAYVDFRAILVISRHIFVV